MLLEHADGETKRGVAKVGEGGIVVGLTWWRDALTSWRRGSAAEQRAWRRAAVCTAWGLGAAGRCGAQALPCGEQKGGRG